MSKNNKFMLLFLKAMNNDISHVPKTAQGMISLFRSSPNEVMNDADATGV